jgi:photosystem II stability/assembly factor-like uncharacterized protein
MKKCYQSLSNNFVNMKYSIRIAFLLALCFSGIVNAQRITQISPGKIVFRGVCMADSTHSMTVGDSAVILFSTAKDTIPVQLVDGKPNPYITLDTRLSKAPCDSTHTFYAVSYYDSMRAVIAADAGLMFRTSDAGFSWTQTAKGMTGQTFRAILHTNDGGLIAVGDSGVMLRSADSGVSWKWVTFSRTRNINGISINASGHGYFVGEHGLIGKTTDFGVTWPSVSDSAALGYLASTPVTLRSVAIGSNDSAVAVGDSGAVGLTPDGIMWYPMSGFPQSNTLDIYSPEYVAQSSFRAVIYTHFFSRTMGWFMVGDKDLVGTVEDTTGDNLRLHHTSPMLGFGFNNRGGDADGGHDILTFSFECAAVWGDSGRFVEWGGPHDGFWWGDVANDTTTLLYTEGGFWENFLFASIDSLGYGFASCTGANFLKTTDNGFTWTGVLLYSNPLGKGNFDGTAMHTIDSNNAFAVGWAGAIYRTSDGGLTWDSTSIGPGEYKLHAIAHPANHVYVVSGDFGTILRSADDAVTWTNITKSDQNIPSKYFEDIAFSTPDTGVAVGEDGTIIRTTDQGLSWNVMPNLLENSSTPINYRQVAAFPSGKYYASTDNSGGLFQSTDHGQNWEQTNYYVNTISMGFFNDSIGVVADSAWSSAIVDDTMRLAFTKDGFSTKPREFNIPIVSNNRMVFHFLDSTSFLCLGSDGFVVKVDVSQGNLSVTDLSTPQTSPIQIFPNPNALHSTTIEYDLDQSGLTTIELWNVLGEKVQTLFTGNEEAGHQLKQLKTDPDLHGSFIVKVTSGAETKTVSISIE